MGQAYDDQGKVIAEAFGKTKKEVFDKLSEVAPNAFSMKIMNLEKRIHEATADEVMHGDECPGPMFLQSPVKDGPCRELSKTILRDRINRLEFDLAGAKHLLSIVEHLQDGSPAEELIWTLLKRLR